MVQMDTGWNVENLLVSFPYKLYIADRKNEIHNDKKLNSIPSHIVLIEESFISPRPNEFIAKILKLK